MFEVCGVWWREYDLLVVVSLFIFYVYSMT
jgi:hypothetical protein